MTPRRALPDVVLLTVAMVWGGSYLAAHDLAASSSAAAVMCARFVPSAVILVLIAFARRDDLRPALVPGTALGLLRAVTIALETIGVTLTTATNAGLIIGLSVLITPILEAASTRRRPPPMLLASAALALVAISLLVAGDGIAAPNLGDALVLCAAVTRAALGVTEARVTTSTRASVAALTTVEVSVGAIIFTLWGGASLAAHAPAFGAGDWMGVVYLSVGCTVFAFLGQLWATKHTSATRAGLILATEPVWALAIGVTLAGDTIGPLGVAGIALLFAATLLGRRAEQRWRGVPVG